MRAFYFTRDENLATKPEVLQIRRATGLSTADVVFHIEEFWRYVNQLGYSLGQTSGQGILPDYELADLPLLVGLNDAYWSAVVKVGWIELGPAGELFIPGFDERFGKLAQRRMSATRRQQRSRANKGQQAARTPTNPDCTVRQTKGQPARSGEPVTSQSLSRIAATKKIAKPLAEPATSRENSAASPTTVDHADSESIAPAIAPARATATQHPSQFDLLSVSDLAVCGKLLCWMADVATMPRPVVLNDAWHQVRVIAAGIRASAGAGVKEPLALFKSIVGKGRWTMLEPEDLQTAQLRLDTYRRGTLTLQTANHERAGPGGDAASAASLVANGFGAIPQPAKQPGAAELLQWDRQRRARTG